MAYFPNATNKYEDLKSLVKRRNRRLLAMFKHNGFNVRLIGDPQKPAVIWDEEYCISGYAKNFDFYFTSQPFDGEIVKMVKLTENITANRAEIEEALDRAEHRKVYKILLDGTSDLYLVGYNYIDPDNSVGRYPVFAKHKPKIYFTEDKAVEISDSLKEIGYFVSVI